MGDELLEVSDNGGGGTARTGSRERPHRRRDNISSCHQAPLHMNRRVRNRRKTLACAEGYAKRGPSQLLFGRQQGTKGPHWTCAHCNARVRLGASLGSAPQLGGVLAQGLGHAPLGQGRVGLEFGIRIIRSGNINHAGVAGPVTCLRQRWRSARGPQRGSCPEQEGYLTVAESCVPASPAYPFKCCFVLLPNLRAAASSDGTTAALPIGFAGAGPNVAVKTVQSFKLNIL